MQRPLPAPLATFPGFRDAYDKYCLAPWSCYRAIEHELIPRIEKAHSKSGMSSDFKTGVQALIDCMKFATVAAERADHEDSIDLVAQTGRLRHGIILSYEEFDVSFSYSVPFRRMREGWQKAEQGFMREWRRYQQGQSTIARLLRSILAQVNMRTVAPGRREPIEQAINGASKRNWLNPRMLERLRNAPINVENYEEDLRTCVTRCCLFPSDDLVCSVMGDAKVAIYTHPDLVGTYYEPELRAAPAPPPSHSTHTPHSLASPLVLKSQMDRQRRRRRAEEAGRW